MPGAELPPSPQPQQPPQSQPQPQPQQSKSKHTSGASPSAKKKPRTCYHCGSPDHRARDCPACVCRRCGAAGHEPPQCPLNLPPPEDLGSFAAGLAAAARPASHGSFRYVELFAGIGGFRVALDVLGGRCVFASEIDRFARQSYEANHKGERPAGDITAIAASSVPPHDLLTAGFPCQPFSFSGKRGGFGDPRGTLFVEIVKLARHHRPKALLLENVRGLLGHDGGATPPPPDLSSILLFLPFLLAFALFAFLVCLVLRPLLRDCMGHIRTNAGNDCARAGGVRICRPSRPAGCSSSPAPGALPPFHRRSPERPPLLEPTLRLSTAAPPSPWHCRNIAACSRNWRGRSADG